MTRQWLEKGYGHLEAVRILLEADHFTDIIAIELQQAVEMTLKAYLAYKNVKIPKTHDLARLCFLLGKHGWEKCEENMAFLELATTYYLQERYPYAHQIHPPKEEIEEGYEIAKNLFEKMCQTVQIDISTLERRA